jgi:orotate phosphoribosyltransferase-like protein
MKKCWTLSRFILISLLCFSSLLFTSACSIPTQDETEMLEDLLNRLDAVEGEITFVTKDGETVNIQITKESSHETDEETGTVKNASKKEVTTEKPADILPSICSKEDVFKLLGISDQAMELRNKGLSWCSTAMELGYTSDSMYTALVAKIEMMLKEACSAGLLSQEKMEYKIEYYSDTGLKWISKIFNDVISNTTVSVSDILPTMESYEDVFELLGTREKAINLREQGLSWSSIAIELGYSEESMYKKIEGVAEQELHDAKINGLINYDQYKEMLELYNKSVESWVKEIFSDLNDTSVSA